MEESPPGTLVGNVSAGDPDEGPNARLQYAILSGDPQNILSIRTTPQNLGVISVRKRIDREQVGTLRLKVVCFAPTEDISTVTLESLRPEQILDVTVHVSDIDDNPPRFSPPLPPSLGVRVDSPIHTEVAVLTALDPDPSAPPLVFTLENVTFVRDSPLAKPVQTDLPQYVNKVNYEIYFKFWYNFSLFLQL